LRTEGTPPPRVVFVGHEASRSGAPIVLLHLLRWLRENAAVDAELLLLKGGDLLDAYRDLVPTSVVGTGRARATALKVLERTADKLKRRPAHIPARLPQLKELARLASRCRHADLLYLNTFPTSALLHYMPRRPPTLLHLHEMSYLLEYGAEFSSMRVGTTEDEYLARTLSLADAVVVPSETSRRQVVGRAPSINGRCRTIPEMIDVEATRTIRPPGAVRAELGIPSGAPVVAACGTFEWRKGTDLFAQVASRVTGEPPVYFVWVGAEPNPPRFTPRWLTRREFDFDVRCLGLEDRVILVPPTPDVADYLAASDVFLLPSREDPFPLVAIEAAALGRPVVCFESSGTAEMIGPDAGIAVRHLDVEAMSVAVRKLLDDPAARASAGQAAARRARDHDIATVAPQLLAEIERLAGRALQLPASVQA
jgi:glycosyltransferase involved in cell wall biosynthesis